MLMLVMAASAKASLLSRDLPDKPHHPKEFPKRTFGKSKPVLCCAQSQWFKSLPFLHVDKAQDVVSCHTTFKLDRFMSSHNAANAFINTVK